MSFAFFWISARTGSATQDEMNQLLRSNSIVAVQRHFCPNPGDEGWAISVEYQEGSGERRGPSVQGQRVDYREILNDSDFQVFSVLRTIRKAIAAEEGVPPYQVATNEQLAEIAKRRCQTKTDLEAVPGFGPSRVEKYAARFFEGVSVSPRNSGDSAE